MEFCLNFSCTVITVTNGGLSLRVEEGEDMLHLSFKGASFSQVENVEGFSPTAYSNVLLARAATGRIFLLMQSSS